MNYQQAWTFLDNLQFFKIKLGLDAMTTFLGRVGNPHQNLACIHIGGTNGKGSVASTLLSILTRAGYRVGLYTSPHLSNVRERFRINDDFMPEEDFARLATRIKDVLAGEQITYFEFTTTMAMLWFAEQDVDLALLEVGMGGRLDATNVIRPLVSVITNVSMDHEQYLGESLAEIAREKAGIIKPGVPVVTGVDDDISTAVVEQTCRKLNAPLYLLKRDFNVCRESQSQQVKKRKTADNWRWSGWDGLEHANLPLAMKGGYQMTNAGLALTVIELLKKTGYTISEQNLHTGLAAVSWPGRLEEFFLSPTQATRLPNLPAGTHFLLDGAHNPAGVGALRQALENEFHYRNLILIWGAMADKDISQTLATMAPLADHIIFTRPESERSAMPEDLLARLPDQYQSLAETQDHVEQALQRAAGLAGKDDLICVAGSLYLVGRARQILRGEQVT
ncbi:MAG TPA: bifunctional folylpolyglutamate synthase/dihydrofolate synthase [Desulfobulbaceae bacterium]|nr:bifunctional folylpolyglutamate synthase/dihydrofolate synthase [Desulfobulbaceae bacterium]